MGPPSTLNNRTVPNLPNNQSVPVNSIFKLIRAYTFHIFCYFLLFVKFLALCIDYVHGTIYTRVAHSTIGIATASSFKTEHYHSPREEKAEAVYTIKSMFYNNRLLCKKNEQRDLVIQKATCYSENL